MKGRKMAFVLLAVVLAMSIAVPSAMSDDSDAVDASDVRVTIRGFTDSIDLELDNNSSSTVVIYIVNVSEKILSVEVSDISTDSLTSSSTVTIGSGTGVTYLSPAGSSGNSYIATIQTTFTTDRLADTDVISDTLRIRLTDLSAAGTADDVAIIEIPVTVDIHSVFMADDAYNKFFGVFPNTLPEPFDNVWFTAAVTLILWLIMTIVVCELVIPLFTRLVRSKKSDEERKTLRNSLTKTIAALMFVIAANECLNIVGANAEIMSTFATLSTVLYVIIGGVISWQIYLFIITALLKGIDDAVDVEGVDTSLIPLFKMIGKLLICVIAVTIIMAAFGVDLAGIMVSAGVVTLGITFGAQEIISQFFSGIVLLASRPFKRGDFLNINGKTYRVRKVRLMFTEFTNWDNDQIVTMPNNVVNSATLVNYTRDTPNTRIFIYVTLGFDANLTLAKELMIRAAKMHPHVVVDGSCTPPGTRLTNFRDFGIEYRLACFVDDYDNNLHYAGQIREIIFKLFKDNGVQLAYTRMHVDVQGVCDGKRRPDDTVDD